MNSINFIFTIIFIFNIALTTNGANVCCTGMGGTTFPCFFYLNIADQNEVFKFLNIFENPQQVQGMKLLFMSSKSNKQAFTQLHKAINKLFKQSHFKKACKLFRLAYRLDLQVFFYKNYGKTPAEIQMYNQCSSLIRRN